MASNGVTRPPALDVTMQEILDALKAVSFRPQVIDNLTSQDSGAPLSANQGRVLKDAIDDIVTQSITDGDTSHAPSGDAVHDALNAISTTISNIPSDLLSVQQKEVTIASVPANGVGDGSLSVARTGYTAIGLVGWSQSYTGGFDISYAGLSRTV